MSLLGVGLALNLLTKQGQREVLSLLPDHLCPFNLYKYNIFEITTLLSNMVEIG